METDSPLGELPVDKPSFETSSEGWKLLASVVISKMGGTFETSSEGWKLGRLRRHCRTKGTFETSSEGWKQMAIEGLLKR